ncbi:hypothetical protein CR513_39256, partial [Mucuna pruriens]
MMKGIRKNVLYTFVGQTIFASSANSIVTYDRALEFCENCVIGKASWLKFSTSVHSSIGVPHYVHLHLWGKSRIESYNRARYFLSIVDDYSIKVRIYSLKPKNRTSKKFKEWKVLVETKTGKKVKKLRTNNGLEFCKEEFSQIFRENEVARHKTVRVTPKQNSLAERFNRTILERVMCMLNHSRLPKNLWAEAVSTTVYSINRCPSTTIGDVVFNA